MVFNLEFIGASNRTWTCSL